MRVSTSLLVCAIWSLAPCAAIPTRAGAIGRRGEGLEPLATITDLDLEATIRAADVLDADEVASRRRQYANIEDGESYVELWVDTDPTFRSSEAEPEGEKPDGESDGGEKDFASNPTPISEGRRRAGMLGILGAIALTTALGYGAYTRRERLKEIIADRVQHLPTVPFNMNRLKYTSLPNMPFHIPTLSMPSFSSLSGPKRSRRRRLRRSKPGFRSPHTSTRSRSWTDSEGLLYDYDYDGDYERGPGHDVLSSPSSSSSDSYAQEAEAFDLGADEDFMIGAPRRSSISSSSPTSQSQGKLRKGMGMGRVWGRWKHSSSGKTTRKGRRTNSAGGSGSGSGTVLFAVAEGDDDLELELETDEAVPLAPTPHRFNQGLGVLKGYGSAG